MSSESIEDDLLEILACPAPDHGRLRPGTASDPDAAALRCDACGRTYPITDGIPVLLLSEVIEGPTGDPGDGPGPVAPAGPEG